MNDSLFGTKTCWNVYLLQNVWQIYRMFSVGLLLFSAKEVISDILVADLDKLEDMASSHSWHSSCLQGKSVHYFFLFLFVYLSNVSFYCSFSLYLLVKCVFLPFSLCFFLCLLNRYSFFIISNFILLSEALLFPFLLCLSFRLFKHYTFTILSLFPPLYICLSISFCISASVCLSTSFLSRVYYFVLLSTFQRLKSYIQSSSIQWWVGYFHLVHLYSIMDSVN